MKNLKKKITARITLLPLRNYFLFKKITRIMWPFTSSILLPLPENSGPILKPSSNNQLDPYNLEICILPLAIVEFLPLFKTSLTSIFNFITFLTCAPVPAVSTPLWSKAVEAERERKEEGLGEWMEHFLPIWLNKHLSKRKCSTINLAVHSFWELLHRGVSSIALYICKHLYFPKMLCPWYKCAPSRRIFSGTFWKVPVRTEKNIIFLLFSLSYHSLGY